MDWLSILWQAKASPNGVVVLVSDVSRARQALYREMRKAAIAGLTIKESPDAKNQIWLINKDNLDAEEVKTSA